MEAHHKSLRISPAGIITGILFFIIFWITDMDSIAQTYPPETQLSFRAMPAGVPRPAYLDPIIDSTFGTQVIRIGDAAKFGLSRPYHQYSKNQPWNSDGTLIMLDGWPGAILDGNTYKKLKTINPSADHHIWSNTNPSTIYGASGNRLESLDALSGTRTTLHAFTEYDKVSIGDWEGNISNDDKYVALTCSKSGKNTVLVYDILNDSILSTKDLADIYPNNVSMSQSGKYVAIQWDRDGPGENEGITIHRRDDLSFVRQVSSRGGTHYDLGYDTEGNEVCCQAGDDRGIVAVRIESGDIIQVTTDAQMSWPQHISCRNLDRPGWLYLTEFAASYGEPGKPNYQQIFAAKIDGSGTVNSFAHVHHSEVEDYDRSPFGVPNRDGTRVMFRSDWEDGTGEVDSYVATMLPDSIAPEMPGGLTASDITSSGFKVSWNPVKDNILTRHYKVFLDGNEIGTTTSPWKRFYNLVLNQTYSVTVEAEDFNGNLSLPSEPLLVRPEIQVSVEPATLKEALFEVAVSPNPMTDQCKLTINSEYEDDFLITVFDLSGRKVFERKLEGKNHALIELEPLQGNHMMILRVMNSDKQVVIKKLFQK